MTPPRLLLVTDPAFPDAHIESVVLRLGEALPRGAFAVQLRDKARESAPVAALAKRLRAATRACGASLLINGDLALAALVEADGVHLGRGAGSPDEARRALPGAWVSVAAHSDDDVACAIREGADAALVSPIYATPGKGPPRGLAAIERAVALADARVVVYALGGVDAARARDCRLAGAFGVAVIRAVLAAEDAVAGARAIADALRA